MNQILIRPYTSRIMKRLGPTSNGRLPIQKVLVKRGQVNELKLNKNSILGHTHAILGSLRRRLKMDPSKNIKLNIDANSNDFKVKAPYKEITLRNSVNTVLERVNKASLYNPKEAYTSYCNDVYITGAKSITVNTGNKKVLTTHSNGRIVNGGNIEAGNLANMASIENRANNKVRNVENKGEVVNTMNEFVENVGNKGNVFNAGTQRKLKNQANRGLVDNSENRCEIINKNNLGEVINPRPRISKR